MKIKGYLQFVIFLFLYLFFYSFESLSQEKPIFITKSNVQIYDSLQVDDGYILLMMDRICSLIDRKGNVVYNFPGNLVSFINSRQEIVTHNEWNLVIYNKELELLWKIPAFIEHELGVTPDNNILFLTLEFDSINNTKVFFNTLVCIDSTKKKTVIWSSLAQRRYLIDFIMKDTCIFRYKIDGSSDPDSVLFKIAPSLNKIKDPTFLTSTQKPERDTLPPHSESNFQTRELFHMNALQIIPANASEKMDTVFRKGNILLSFNNFTDSIKSFIAIVDPVNFKILWYYVQKDGRCIHTPTMLPNGHILVYVNTRNRIPYSCIDEIDPITNKVVWSYTEDFPLNEKRKAMGSCQRLPNGNTLISNVLGYVYEVTPAKKIVWESNSQLITKGSRYIYRAYWYPKENFKWLINE